MITTDQKTALDSGEAVPVEIDGKECVILSKEVYERISHLLPDGDEWTSEERDLLAAEAADMLAGDGFDYPDDDE